MDIFQIQYKIGKYSFKLMNGSCYKKKMYQQKYDIYRNILKQHGGGLCSVCFKNDVNRLYAYDDFYMCKSCKTCVCGDCLKKIGNICPNENKKTKWEEYDDFDPVLIERMPQIGNAAALLASRTSTNKKFLSADHQELFDSEEMARRLERTNGKELFRTIDEPILWFSTTEEFVRILEEEKKNETIPKETKPPDSDEY